MQPSGHGDTASGAELQPAPSLVPVGHRVGRCVDGGLTESEPLRRRFVRVAVRRDDLHSEAVGDLCDAGRPIPFRSRRGICVQLEPGGGTGLGGRICNWDLAPLRVSGIRCVSIRAAAARRRWVSYTTFRTCARVYPGNFAVNIPTMESSSCMAGGGKSGTANLGAALDDDDSAVSEADSDDGIMTGS